MIKRKRLNFAYRFVNMGAVAPRKVPQNELWLDVGNRVDNLVLDHHGESMEAWSAAELVMNKYQDLILPFIEDKELISVVLHVSPDVDAICSAWLAKLIIQDNKLPEPKSVIQSIVSVVSENDQGFVRTEAPEKSWIIVFRTLLETDYAEFSDEEKVKAGMHDLDLTFKTLQDGGTLSEAASILITPSVRSVIVQAQRDYIEDLSRGYVFQLRLPVRTFMRKPSVCVSKPLDIPDSQEANWSLADGIFLDEPKSKLFKEMARGDKVHSPSKRGFDLMVVTRDIKGVNTAFPLQRHIISTNPLTGFYLQGLGKKLELLEQTKEDNLQYELPPERKRVKMGEGRHGYNVPSPWYDGRGHFHTIIDSPSFSLNNQPVCGSLLSSKEVLEALWDYGNPAQFVNVLEAELVLICPAQVGEGCETQWSESAPFAELAPDFSEEIKQIFDESSSLGSLSIHLRRSDSMASIDGVFITEQQLWRLLDDYAIWVGRFRFDSSINNMFKLGKVVNLIKHSKLGNLLSPEITPGIKLLNFAQSLHIVNCRIPPTDLSLKAIAGPSAQIMHQLATASGVGFFQQAEKDELSTSIRVFSRDQQNVAYVTDKGVSVVSLRNTALAQESGFHNPKQYQILISLAFLQKTAVQHLAVIFAKHRCERNYGKAAKLVLEDRWRLLSIEQSLLFSHVSELHFGQASFEALVSLLKIKDRLSNLADKIEELSRNIQEMRANFYQKIAFCVTVFFAPLAITASFFSGTHMQRHFADTHIIFLNSIGEMDGWIQFAIVLSSLTFATMLLWMVTKWMFSKRNALRFGRKGER